MLLLFLVLSPNPIRYGIPYHSWRLGLRDFGGGGGDTTLLEHTCCWVCQEGGISMIMLLCTDEWCDGNLPGIGTKMHTYF